MQQIENDVLRSGEGGFSIREERGSKAKISYLYGSDIREESKTVN